MTEDIKGLSPKELEELDALSPEERKRALALKIVPEMNPIREDFGAIENKSAFGIYLHSFKFLERKYKRWPGKRLRFTLTLHVPVSAGGKFEYISLDMEGCTARCNNKNELLWSPCQNRSGSWYSNNIYVSPSLYMRVKRALEQSKYVNDLQHVSIMEEIPIPLDYEKTLRILGPSEDDYHPRGIEEA